MNKRFAVVDIETTGGLFRRDRITEIAVVVCDGENILDEFQSLVNPGIAIPPFVIKITGITNEMVAVAPPFHEVAKQVVEITKGCIFVAHNVRFDYGFIREAFSQLGFSYNRKRMCTVQMARRILQLKSHSLESLIKYYNIPVENRHRAMDDARATVVVLHNLLKLEGGEEDLNKQINRGARESLLPNSISLEDLHELPEATGVYYMLDANGKALYVGKSTNIQKRIMQHFAKTTKKSENMQRLVHKIDYKLTGSELIALIEESKEIKKLRPELNKAQRKKVFDFAIVSSVNSLGYIRFDVRKRWTNEDEALNTYSSSRFAKSILHGISEDFELCPLYLGLEIGMGPCSKHQFDTCAGACIHEEDADSYNKRALLAKKHLDNRLPRDILVLDQGRNTDETGAVLVLDGQYYGHGYLDRSISYQSVEDIMEDIPKGQYFPEFNAFIQKYLDQGSGDNVIFLEDIAEGLPG